jgi:hypothetical protein
MTDIDLKSLQQWLGRTETDQHTIGARTVAQMAGTLGLDTIPAPGGTLPMP